MIRQLILRASVVLVLLSSLAGGLVADQPEKLTEDQYKALKLWQQIRRSDVNSRQFILAKKRLADFIAKLPADRRFPVAAVMMTEKQADSSANAAALELFGKDGIGVAEFRPVLNNDKPNWQEGMVVLTYYKFVRPEYETRLSEKVRRQLVSMLAERLNQLVVYPTISYSQQRFISHALGAVLSRYARQQDTPEMKKLIEAMRAYAAASRDNNSLGASIKGWLGMLANPKPKLKTPQEAMGALGHWEPMVRLKAAAKLGDIIRTDPAVGELVMMQLNDPRDEVREAAASVFSFALSYRPQRVIPAMVKLLVWDVSVPVQRAAGKTLVVHSDEAQVSADLLLNALKDRRPRPGPKRTASLLETLSYLIHPNMPTSQKQRLLSGALDNLDYAPAGALRAMESLGPYARSALPAIKLYRDEKADRFTRQYIDRHVLPAIDPSAGQ